MTSPYENWMRLVDEEVWSIAGCSVYDLPDFCSRDMFESGVSAEEAAREVLEEAGFPAEE